MPNLKPTYQYTARMIRLERQLIAGIQRALAEFRRDSLDALYSSKVNHELMRQITTFIERMTDKIKLLQSAILQPLDETALWYMNQQLGLLRAVGEKRLPNIQQLNLSTYSKRMDAYELLKVPPAWITTMKKNMELNLTRGMISKVDTTSLVERLFAVNVLDGRASVARLAGVAAETEVKSNIWTASILSMFALYDETKNQTGTIYSKQAIAAIDSKTTDCCLQVHGQIQPLDKPFHLTGTPRFADYVDSPPFHWNCRTAEALYTESMEEKGTTTSQMKDAADAELTARAITGKRQIIWPSHATSRRGG